MWARALRVLGCPQCHGPLEPGAEAAGDLQDGVLVCSSEGLRFPVAAGVPQLVRPDRVDAVLAFAVSFSATWTRDGWGRAAPGSLLNLPYRSPSGRPSSRWRVKARSMDALFALTDRIRPARVVDLGSGVGWLAHHLAQRGCEVYAVDAVLDGSLGLEAAREFLEAGAYFERVWGELADPPFQDGSVDMVVCNASLHYGAWQETLASVSRILRPGGTAVVMNSPVHSDPGSASRAEASFRKHLRGLGAGDVLADGYHHLTRDGLTAAMADRIGPAEEWPFDPGTAFRWYRRLKSLALRIEYASFPILYARKEPNAGAR